MKITRCDICKEDIFMIREDLICKFKSWDLCERCEKETKKFLKQLKKDLGETQGVKNE